MSNPAVVTLASLQDNIPSFPYRFEIEDNVGEAIHVHFKDIRLDLTIKEFLRLADTARALIGELVTVPGFEQDQFDPVQLVEFIGHMPHTREFIDDTVYLADIVVDTVNEEGAPCYDTLEHSRVLRALRGDTEQNDRHHQVNFFKPNSVVRYTNAERLKYNLETVRAQGYPHGKERIMLLEDSNIIWDGQHRAACLFFLKGNVKVPVRRICFKDTAQRQAPVQGRSVSLYYRGAEGEYREEKRFLSSDIEISKGYIFQLEPGTSHVRFDPTEGEHCVVSDLFISCGGETIEPRAANGLQYDGRYYFFTDDPQIEIELPSDEEDRLAIRASIAPLGPDALDSLIRQMEAGSADAAQKTAQIQQLSGEMAEMQTLIDEQDARLSEKTQQLAATQTELAEQKAQTERYMQAWQYQENRSKQLYLNSQDLDNALTVSRERSDELQRQLDDLRIHYEDILRSLSFRLGRILTWLPRKIKHLFMGISMSAFASDIRMYLPKTFVYLKRYGVRKTVWKIGQKLRNRDPLAETAYRVDSYGDYHNWLARYGTVRDEDIVEMRSKLADFKHLPLISVVIPVYNTDHAFLRTMLDSVLKQAYPHFEICIADDASPDEEVRTILREYREKDARIKVVFRPENGGICAASNSALAEATGEFVALVDHDDYLPAEALYTICHYIDLYDDEVDLLYTDEDKLDAQGVRFDPYFKGGWNRRLVYQQNFVAHLGVYRRTILNEIGGFREGFEGSQDYDLLLRFLKRTTDARIVHVPYILYSWRKNLQYGSFSTKYQDKADLAAKRALEEYFEGRKQILPREGLCGCWRIRAAEKKERPLVSVIIPMKDKAGLLKNCIRGLLEKTDYPNIEILIVDNGSREEKTFRYFKELDGRENIRILRDDGPFNYSHLNNEAAEQARGEQLLFLNNDIAVIKEDWLANMVDVAMEEGVGAVGAKLLYANNNVQHAGVVTGIYEVAGHLYRHTHDSNGGYFGLLFLEKNVSAVTGACMLVPKRVFQEVGGFDEQNLAVSFNDVDLCLRIRNAGYDVVYTPDAKLYHLESQSRGMDVTKAQKEQNYKERRVMHQKYGKALMEDPYYSPVLSLTNEDGNLTDRPRVGKPWRDQIEFVCPFHRGDVLIGLQVACTAAKHGIKVRMHVSRDLIRWLDDFEYGAGVTIEPIDIGIPTAEQTAQFLREAIDKVALREDSSCRIICSHPVRNLEDMGIDLVENMLRQFGLPIDTKLINVGVKRCTEEHEKQLREMVGYPLEKTVLLHPYGGWQLKSMSPDIVKKTVEMCHAAGYKVVQIGGAADARADETDGTLLKNLPLSAWAFLFRSARAVIGVDSWTAHFASIMDVDQAIVYGSTDHRDVGSKRHFVNSNGKCVVIPSRCDQVPCNSLVCRRGSAFCAGMDIGDKLKDLL